MDLAALMAAGINPGQGSNMQKVFDPKGLTGEMARGSNVYLGGLPSAPGAGRPRNPAPVMNQQMNPALMAAINQRLMGYGKSQSVRPPGR
jgi:hypothetical protein